MFWLGEEAAGTYKESMGKLEKNFFFKTLVEWGDDYFAGSEYAEYRWAKKDDFSNVPFYVYGDKLAIILFGKEVIVYLLENKDISDAYRKVFNVMWERADVPAIKGHK